MKIDREENTLLRCALDGFIRTLQSAEPRDEATAARRQAVLDRALGLFNRLLLIEGDNNDGENRWRQALVNEVVATFECEGCDPFALRTDGTIPPLTKVETDAVIIEAFIKP